MAKKNKTKKNARKPKDKTFLKRIVNGDAGTKMKVGPAAIQMGRDMLLGGLAGGVLGHLAGRPGALIGLVLNGAAWMGGTPGLASFGTGMFAAGLFKPKADPKNPNPNARMADGSTDDGNFPKKKGQLKARLQQAKDAILHNLYLDSLFKKKEEETTEKGGSDSGGGAVGYLGNPTLDEIEAQLMTSAMNFQREQGGEVIAGPEDFDDFDEFDDSTSMMAMADDEMDRFEEEDVMSGDPDEPGEADFEFATDEFEFDEVM